MSIKKIDQLKSCKDRKDLARLLGYAPKSLSYILYELKAPQNYRTFKIPKRKGGDRVIDAPGKELLFLQRRASSLLQDCLQDAIENEGHESSIHHGFQRGKSIITNATLHKGRRFVFNIDLEDFFPSINFGRVYSYLKKNRNFQLADEVAVTLAQICCYNGKLPQGAATSPVISNLICQTLDVRLAKLANKYGCTYSRYADDITFSTSEKKFPRQISRKQLLSSNWKVGKKLKSEILDAGFTINETKVRMQYSQSRQTVTGLIVNKKVNVPAEYEHESRAMVHSYVTTGHYHIRRRKTDSSGNSRIEKEPGTAAQLIGRYSYIHNVKMASAPSNDIKNESLCSYEKDYRRLLLFSMLHFSESPMLLMEGKTDSIYIKAALRKLHKDYPSLISKKGKKFEYKIRFFQFSKTNRRILGIDGGTSHLASFLSAYRKESKKFCKIDNQKPVICILDNDSGAKPFLSWKDSSGNKITTSGSPFHLFENVYLIFTPNPPGKSESKIEDYFSRKVLDTEISGKRFNSENTAASEKEYGKAWFATKVVWPKKSKIRFDAFKPLLDLINTTSSKIHNPK